MILKTFILLVLATLVFGFPQDDGEIKVDKPDVDISAIKNRIEFVSSFTHKPEQNVKEGDILTFTYSPPKAEDADAVSQLVKSFTIAIGTGTGTMVDDQFFIESERLPIPTAQSTYNIQLPPQMEAKQYCIVYTPYATETVEAGNQKATLEDGTPLESLYETWFAIKGSLAEGAGPKTAVNTYDNSANAANANAANANAGAAAGATDAAAGATDRGAGAQPNVAAGQPDTTQANAKSGSITISPAITAFIAILFACFFI